MPVPQKSVLKAEATLNAQRSRRTLIWHAGAATTLPALCPQTPPRHVKSLPAHSTADCRQSTVDSQQERVDALSFPLATCHLPLATRHPLCYPTFTQLCRSLWEINAAIVCAICRWMMPSHSGKRWHAIFSGFQRCFLTFNRLKSHSQIQSYRSEKKWVGASIPASSRISYIRFTSWGCFSTFIYTDLQYKISILITIARCAENIASCRYFLIQNAG